VVVVWLAVMGGSTASGLGETWAAAARGLGEPPAQRIQRASGISPAFAAAIREAVPRDGRLVLYSPYAGPEFEFVLRLLFERTKNLLYPAPRDVAFARLADELRGHVQPDMERRLVVVDGTQERVDLSIGGAWDLLHTEPLGAHQLRLWRLRKVMR
jgi:hypothetical protein